MVEVLSITKIEEIPCTAWCLYELELDFRITQLGSKVSTQNPTQPRSGLSFSNPDLIQIQY
jgi:hypothetical protein